MFINQVDTFSTQGLRLIFSESTKFGQIKLALSTTFAEKTIGHKLVRLLTNQLISAQYARIMRCVALQMVLTKAV